MAKQAYASGQYADAIRVCDRLVAHLGPRDDVLNIKALALLASGQVEAAETSMRQALKLNPRIAGMQLNAAGIYKALSLNKQVKMFEDTHDPLKGINLPAARFTPDQSECAANLVCFLKK